MKYDIIVKNGCVIDGAGNPWYKRDIGIKDGKIEKIGSSIQDTAEKVIDAQGLFVSPGFIDIHTHSDSTLLTVNGCETHIMQGITTECIGNCGSSPYPITEMNKESIHKRMSSRAGSPKIEIDWVNLDGYIRKLSEVGVSVNVAPLVGHGTVRAAVIGMKDREPSLQEMEQMKVLVEAAMKEGAFGLSSGLDYLPGSYAKTSEVIELAKTVAKYGGLYASHIREQSLYSHAKAIEELIEIGEKSGARVHCAHRNPVFPFWGDEIKNMENWRNARKNGIDITADLCIPGPIRSKLSRIFPPWWRWKRGDDEKERKEASKKLVENLRDAETRQKIRQDTLTEDWYAPDREKTGEIPNFNHCVKNNRWDLIRICDTYKGEIKNWRLIGKTLEEVSKIRGVEPFDALCDLIIEEKDEVYGESYLCLTESSGRELIKDPVVMMASDSSCKKNCEPWTNDWSQPHREHPFPYVLGPWVREHQVLSLEDMVKKCTSLPARTLGLFDRGLVAKGMCADLVVFDAKTVDDNYSYEEPYRYPVGIQNVIVNGIIAKDEDKHTGKLPGKVLRHSQ